jgi:zinc transport system ATP-binding protein
MGHLVLHRTGLATFHSNVLFDPTFPISVEEVVRMGRLRPLSVRYSEDDNRAVACAMEQTDITDLNTRPYAALSGGQRRRCSLHEPLLPR